MGEPMPRREYRTGSVYQRCEKGKCPPLVDGERPKHSCGGTWIATIEGVDEYGYTSTGGRKRITVSGRTKQQAIRRRRDRIRELEQTGGNVKRTTVKQWAEEYLDMKVRTLAPKGYNAAANPIKNWVVPTIGHKRLDQLTPADVRAVHDACRRAKPPRQPGDVHRALLTMLRAAVAEGRHVPPPVLATRAPAAKPSDRAAMTVEEGLACLDVASTLPHGIRWVFTLLYGARLGECLGMTWDALDFDSGLYGEAVIEWQLQALPYNVPRDRSSGFRVPDGYEARHLVDAFHLVRPKSRKGYRVAPFLPPVRDGLLKWREEAPANPHGLVWPSVKGRPANELHDRREWHALQGTAEVGHPSGRPYHIHECRNFAATMLLEAGVPAHVVTDLLGHTDVATSIGYKTVRREPLLDAMERVGRRLQLG